MEKARNVDIRQFYREDLGVHSEKLLDKLEAVSQAVTPRTRPPAVSKPAAKQV